MIYLFDFDGTLADSMPTFCEVMVRVIRECGIEPPSDFITTVTPLGYGGSAKYFRELGAQSDCKTLVKRMHELARYEYEQRIPLKATVRDTLMKMKERGDGLNVLTASPHGMLDPCLKRCGVWELFDNVWSCEDFSASKSDPHIYEMAAEALGTEVRSVIFVDDNPVAVDAARRGGMISVGIYDDSSADLVERMKAVSDGYVNTLAELLTLNINR